MNNTSDYNLIDDTGEGVCILHIDNFDGPLDLLWDLIKRAKVDITEVSISEITEQYIRFLKSMKDKNIRIASEFIVMASDLLYYKSRALLPIEEFEDEYFIPPLPPDLLQRLLEYKKYQKASCELMREFENQSDYIPRVNRPFDQKDKEVLIDVSLFELLNALVDVMESNRTSVQEEIIFDEILISDMVEHIGNLIRGKEYIHFDQIFSLRSGRAVIVVSFLAILEMVKSGSIKLLQHRIFGDIRIYSAP